MITSTSQFLYFVKRFKLKLFTLFIVVLLQTIINIISVISLAPIIDLFTKRKDEEFSNLTLFFKKIFLNFNIDFQLIHSFILFGFLIFLASIVGLWASHLNIKLKYSIFSQIKVGMMNLFLKSDYSFFNLKKLGEFINTFDFEVNKVCDALDQLIRFSVALIQIMLIMIIPLYLSIKFTLIFFICIFLIISPMIFFKNYIHKLSEMDTKSSNELTNALYQILSSVKLIYSYGMNENAKKHFTDYANKHVNAAVSRIFFATGIPLIFSPLIIISLMISSYFIFKTGYPLSELVVILFSFQKMAPHIANAVKCRVVITSTKASFDQIKDYENEAKKASSIDGKINFKGFNDDIVFKDISFNYKKNKNLFEKINLSFKKNSITGLIGPSGSGKTTLVDLLTGMLKPTRGQILIDKKNLNDYKISSFRSKIGYIPQDPTLFNISIKENLLWANNKASEEDIKRALSFVEINKFIDTLPDGINTIVGERGDALSGGQRQRIAFARAIIRKPEILIMDEATASLDQKTQELIENKLEELSSETTIIFISHSSRLFKRLSKVYSIDNGIIKKI